MTSRLILMKLASTVSRMVPAVMATKVICPLIALFLQAQLMAAMQMSIVFENTTTAIEAPFEEVSGSNNAAYYNLNGQNLNGKPTRGGLYIMNGKKVLVK